ncbi:hypothetical protein [Hyperthermus butylicus]|uniref:hypothetical protein n=1 Tax=Hyperthermus butylicus TaxID=54248 RepID=UPI00129AA7D2|nr:hypothetical protein [Hyperthermus butylicus]
MEGQNTLILLLYSFASSPEVSSASLWSHRLIESSSVAYHPERISRSLSTPMDHGAIIVNVTATNARPGEMVNLTLSLVLKVDYAGGERYRSNLSLPLELWVLSVEGGIPKALSYGVASSLIVVATSPILAFLYIRGSRRAIFLILALVAVIVLASLKPVIYGFRSSSCTSDGFVLRYLWTSPEGVTGVFYVWSDGRGLCS